MKEKTRSRRERKRSGQIIVEEKSREEKVEERRIKCEREEKAEETKR